MWASSPPSLPPPPVWGAPGSPPSVLHPPCLPPPRFSALSSKELFVSCLNFLSGALRGNHSCQGLQKPENKDVHAMAILSPDLLWPLTAFDPGGHLFFPQNSSLGFQDTPLTWSPLPHWCLLDLLVSTLLACF